MEYFITKTKYENYVVTVSIDKNTNDIETQRACDCLNLQLLNYHFPNLNMAQDIAISLSESLNGENIQEILDGIGEEYNIFFGE